MIRRKRKPKPPPRMLAVGDLILRESDTRNWLSSDEYHLMVEYNGYSRAVDRQLFKIVGKFSDGSGFMFGTETRDHDWWIKSKAKALAAVRKLRAAKITVPEDPWIRGPRRAKRARKQVPVKLRVRLVGPIL